MPKRLLLHYTHVAGYAYALGSTMAVHKRLLYNCGLTMVREPDNPYDANAIALYTREHIKLGYIPRVDNEYLAFLLDLGIDIECLALNVQAFTDDHVHIDIGVVLGYEPVV